MTQPDAMTVDEAKAILDANRDGYEDFSDPACIVIDGKYTLQELRALVIVATAAAERSGA